MTSRQTTAEEIKAGYRLPESIREIEEAYPFLFAVYSEAGVHHYAVDPIGKLYTLCVRCQEDGRKVIKPVGWLADLDEDSGKTIKRPCGHPCYLPSLPEVRACRPHDFDFFLAECTRNRIRATTAPKPRSSLSIALALCCVAVAALGYVVYSLRSPAAAVSSASAPDEYVAAANLVSAAEDAHAARDPEVSKKIAAARTVLDQLEEKNPGWILPLLKLRSRIEKLEGHRR